MKIANQDVDLSKKDEQYRVLEYIRMKKIKTLPLLSYILIGCAKFEDSGANNFYAWSVFNPSSQFYTIKLNWAKIAQDNLTVEILEFIAYHNVLHHILLHFVREPIVKYYQESSHHADICMDTVINEYLLHHLGFAENASVTQWVEQNGFTYQKFAEYFQLAKLPFNNDTVVAVEQLIVYARDFEKKQQSCSSPSAKQLKSGGEENNAAAPQPALSSAEDNHNAAPESESESESEAEAEADAGNDPVDTQNTSAASRSAAPNDQINTPQVTNTPRIFDDHQQAININQELKNKTAMPQKTLEELFMNSQDNIVERARQRGITPAKEEERFITILKNKVNYLSVVKLKNLSSSFSKGKKLRTWSKIHRHKQFFTGIHYPAKKLETKKHIVYAIDTSGSVSTAELQSIKSIIINHAKQYDDEIVCDIIIWSGTVTNVYKNISSIKKIINLSTTTTWATNIDKLFDHIQEQYTKKIICVVLTDGEISAEKPSSIIEKLYFALTKQDSLASVKKMYPMATVLSLII